jgi:hypothetical protein
MSYTVEVNGKDVIVSHPSSPEPKVLAGWTWHAELVRQLIAERDQLRARLAAIDAAPTVASLGIGPDGKHSGLYFPHPHRSALTATMDERDGWTIKELIARPEAK